MCGTKVEPKKVKKTVIALLAAVIGLQCGVALYRVYLPECRATDEHCLNWVADAEVRIRTKADDTT